MTYEVSMDKPRRAGWSHSSKMFTGVVSRIRLPSVPRKRWTGELLVAVLLRVCRSVANPPRINLEGTPYVAYTIYFWTTASTVRRSSRTAAEGDDGQESRLEAPLVSGRRKARHPQQKHSARTMAGTGTVRPVVGSWSGSYDDRGACLASRSCIVPVEHSGVIVDFVL
jgi:hypothetical protein